MPTRLKSSHVFINCPFDAGYRPIFNAIVFAVYDLGFVARCALEEDDAGDYRLAKIERIIEECRFGINDLSAVALDAVTNLPRFNMPLELGLFFGCKRYGPRNQAKKKTLVLDADQHRYRQFISDISGQDIHAHGGDPERAIREVRDWLQGASRREGLAGGGEIVRRYRLFRADLPKICRDAGLETDKLTFLDLSEMVTSWLKANR
ncbi:MAG: hypothetical protein IT168_31465 [Bryobacterales bacterium]|nr:hypothetical protein [Bryobacterales bacterium]